MERSRHSVPDPVADGKGQAGRLPHLRQELARTHGSPQFLLFEGVFLTLQAFCEGTPDTVAYWGSGGQRPADRHVFDPISTMVLLKRGELLLGEDVRNQIHRPGRERVIQGGGAPLWRDP